MKLYEISDQMKQLQVFLEENEDVSIEAIQDTMESLELAFVDKVEGAVQVLKGFEAESEALKAEAKRLTERAKAAEKKASNLKDYLDFHMKQNEKDELKAGIFRLSYRKAPPSVEIEDIKALPNAYKKTKIEVKPDKTAIKKAFKDGESVPGAKLIDDKKILQIK